MKRFSVLTAIFLFFLFGVSEVYSQSGIPCQPGLTSRTQTINIGGCDFDVEFCFWCSPTSDSNKVYMNSYVKLDTNCVPMISGVPMSPGQIIAAIYSWLRSGNNLGNLCTNTVPCGQNHINVQVYEPICWQISLIEGKYYYGGCFDNDAYCYENWEVCYDTQLGVMRWTKTYGPGIAGYPDCTTEWTPILDSQWQNDLTVQNPRSPCFHVPNNLCGY